MVEETETYARIRSWMQRNERRSGWMIFILAFLPLPVFDLAGMAAGALKMSLLRFLTWALAGKILKMWLVAWMGQAGIHILGL